MANNGPTKRRHPLLKALGCLLVVALLIGVVVGGVALFQSSLEVLHRETVDGEAELDAALARFAGSRQYLDIVRRDGLITTVVHHEREPAHAKPIRMLHGLLWEGESGRLVRASTPAWVLDVTRWKTQLTAPLLQPLEQRLGLEVALPDLAPFGPGLILDHHGAHGRRIVIWAEGDS